MRDIHTGPRDAPRTLAHADLDADLNADNVLRRLRVDLAPPPGVVDLEGRLVGPGFRRAAGHAWPEGAGGPLASLLDDLPIAVLLRGYAIFREAARRGEGTRMGNESAVITRMADLCSGWRTGGTLLDSITRGRGVPMQPCPEALPLVDPEDPAGWHDVGPVTPGTLRRSRRLDVTPGLEVQVDAHFRDSYGEPDGREVVLHEYGLAATIDPSTLVIGTIRADPLVLPYDECPHAAASVGALTGSVVADVRAVVRNDLVGIAGCTHLSDLLMTLAGVPALLEPGSS